MNPISTGKQYSNVKDLVNATAKDAEFKRNFEEEFNARKLVRMLSSARASRGITQTELARKLGYGQPRISKIENSRDDSLRVRDIVDYAKALEINIAFHVTGGKRNAADEIKFHAFEMKRKLEELAELADGDAQLIRGITHFFGEAFFNVTNMIVEAAEKLPTPDDDTILDVFAVFSSSKSDVEEGQREKELNHG